MQIKIADPMSFLQSIIDDPPLFMKKLKLSNMVFHLFPEELEDLHGRSDD